MQVMVGYNMNIYLTGRKLNKWLILVVKGNREQKKIQRF